MRKSYFCGGSLIALAALAAFAQPSAAATATVEQPADAQRLEEVVVVARRTEERLQDVPISVTAISADTLKQTQIASATDLIKLVPSLSVQQGATGPGTNYSLRGIRTGVITYFNEVPTNSVGIDDQIWDLSSVQALAGPQGTLFGRNSTGGAILFVPQRPTGDFGGWVEGSLGNYNYRQLTGVLNIPVGEMLKVRLGARVVRRDGVVESIVANGSDMQSLSRESYRASFLFTPTSKISNLTMVDLSKRDELPYALIADNWAPGVACTGTAALLAAAGRVPSAPCLPGYTPGLVNRLADAQLPLGIRSTSATDPVVNLSESYGISNIFTVELLPNLNFKYVAGYRYRDSIEYSSKANIDLPIELGKNLIFGIKDWTNEVQLQGKLFDRLSWTTGLFTSRQKSFTGSEYYLFLPPGSVTTTARNEVPDPRATANRTRYKTETKAAFVQATLKVTDALNVTAGVRYTEDEATTRNTRRTPQLTFFGPSICGLPAGATGVDLASCVRTLNGKWDATTYNVSADYRFSEALLVYATTRRGYNGGGFNGSVPDTATPGAPLPTYDPEYITDYEVGVKTDWSLGGMPLRANLSVFKAKYTDIQRNQRGFSTTGAIYSGTANGPEASIKGAQLESAIRPIPELTLTANYGWLDTRYDKGSNGFSQGNKFAQAPEHTFNASATYQHEMSQGVHLVGSINYTYQSEVTFQDDQAAAAVAFQKGYGIWDARAGWQGVGGGPLDVNVFVKNLTDEAYAIERQDQRGLFGFVGSVYNDPRTFGVEVRYAFGG